MRNEPEKPDTQSEDRTVCVDTHFHANIDILGENARRKKAAKLARSLGHLDILCSTEHAYKHPLEAFDFLHNMQQEHESSFDVVPGVENISSEGVELIFLASDRKHLEEILTEFPPFKWSIKDFQKIKRSTAQTIVPHPFTPSKTGVVTSCGFEAAIEIMAQSDFVEYTNGAFLSVNPAIIPNKRLREKVRFTGRFPGEHKGMNMRGSIGTDAHRAADINCFGRLTVKKQHTTSFDILKNAKSMELETVKKASGPKIWDRIATLSITSIEAGQKAVFKRKAK